MPEFSTRQLNFMPGLDLNRRYSAEVLQPLIRKFDPALVYSAALIGYGSDVLGYDTPTSMDHNWGPRGQIFLLPADAERIPALDEYLRQNLPPQFLGFPTHFTDKRIDHTQSMTPHPGGEVNHLIEIYVLQDYLRGQLGKDPQEFTSLDWLRLPEQELLELTSGAVFHDALGLNQIREQFAYYPAEIRLLKLAAYWNHIANEEAFVGRCRERADAFGVKLISTRLLTSLLKICFVLKGRYVPYSKWFTRAFSDLGLAGIEAAALELLQENDLSQIESKLAALYLRVLELQNSTPGIPSVELEIISYYNRPFRVIMAERIIEPLRAAISEPSLQKLDLNEVGLDNRVDGIDLNNNSTLGKIFRK
ncbi:MAG: DUF4037 domain-containing protein [Anaerolineaceae bacterium]|nr:DUF4037 domain-containing protein [Anaerolineaceae bacterium]